MQELSTQLKKGAVNIIDVLKNIDEMNYTTKDEEEYKKNQAHQLLEKPVRKETAAKKRDA